MSVIWPAPIRVNQCLLRIHGNTLGVGATASLQGVLPKEQSKKGQCICLSELVSNEMLQKLSVLLNKMGKKNLSGIHVIVFPIGHL